MPNHFIPRAFNSVVEDRVERLRIRYDGEPGHVKRWHALLDMLDDDATQTFKQAFPRAGEIPHVVSGFEDDGRRPEEDEGGAAA